MKNIIFIYTIASAFISLALSSCTSEVEALTAPDRKDSNGVLCFGTVGMGGGTDFAPNMAKTRAAGDVYLDWSADRLDPKTMGIFGYYDKDGEATFLFENDNNHYTAPGNEQTWSHPIAESNWCYDYKAPGGYKNWATYSTRRDFNFFAYMPHIADVQGKSNVSLSGKGTNKVTLTLPNMPSIMPLVAVKDADNKDVYDISNGDGSHHVKIEYPVGKNPKEYTSGIYVCNNPQYRANALDDQSIIKFNMDLLTAEYDVSFKLDERYEEVRRFDILEAKLFNVPMTVTIHQAYNFADGTWTKGATTYSAQTDTYVQTAVSAADISHAERVYPLTETPITLNKEEFKPCGIPFVSIPFPYTCSVEGASPEPDNLGAPMLMVKYQVYDTAVDKPRAAVTQAIAISGENFGDMTGPTKAGNAYHIQILVKPLRLYELSDADQPNLLIVK